MSNATIIIINSIRDNPEFQEALFEVLRDEFGGPVVELLCSDDVERVQRFCSLLPMVVASAVKAMTLPKIAGKTLKKAGDVAGDAAKNAAEKVRPKAQSMREKAVEFGKDATENSAQSSAREAELCEGIPTRATEYVKKKLKDWGVQGAAPQTPRGP